EPDPHVHVGPGEGRLPTQTHVEGEAAAGPEVILNVEADRLIADILGFAGSLAVGAQLSQKEAGQGIVGGVGSETISTELVKQIVLFVHTAQVSAEAEGQPVPA